MKLTKKQFTAHFQEEVLPAIRTLYEPDKKPDRPRRRMVWNDLIDSGIKSGELPKRAGDWVIPHRLETGRTPCQ
jgi:hypothetical protein